MDINNLLDIRTRAELYQWYLENHDKVSDFWLRVNRGCYLFTFVNRVGELVFEKIKRYFHLFPSASSNLVWNVTD